MKIPLGITDFSKLINTQDFYAEEGSLYVDKSLFIQEILKDNAEVIVITRPRRFGKSLNLSMLEYFFSREVKGYSTQGLFKDLAIATDKLAMQEQGQYPIIFLNLKDAKYANFDLCYEYIKYRIIKLYDEYSFLLESPKLTYTQKKVFQKFLEEKVERIDIDNSLYLLSEFIYVVTGKEVIILVDEYDTPLEKAYLQGYYQPLIGFMSNLFGSCLKGNRYLHKAVLTGVVRIAKESLFSGLNNLKVYSLLHEKYAPYFGFTEPEVEKLLVRANLLDKLKMVKEWYNGYNFGGLTIYNPWSIMNFIAEQGKLDGYWINTSGNELVKDIILNPLNDMQEGLEKLLSSLSVKEQIDEHIVFNELVHNKASIWSLLLMCGYLKYTAKSAEDGFVSYDLTLPNKEVEYFYVSVIKQWINGNRGANWYLDFLRDLTNGTIADFKDKLQTLALEIVSFHDVTSKTAESFYHGLMLAFVCGLKNNYSIRSNKEAGLGRYDIILIPKDLKALGIIMEFKVAAKRENMLTKAEEALTQIEHSQYREELGSAGVKRLRYLGIVVVGKLIEVVGKDLVAE